MIIPTNGAELSNAMIDLICSELCFSDLTDEELNYYEQHELCVQKNSDKSYVLHMDSRAIA